MARSRKAIFNGGVYAITTSVETGLMLPCNPLIIMLIKSAILRAQLLYPDIKISHFIVEGTHIHLLLRCYNPEDVPGFMERVKTESSHYINRLLGRKKRTIWQDSYDCQRLLTPADVIDKIAYIYNNPVKDGLVSSITKYPGLSSWAQFCSPKSHLRAYRLRRAGILPAEQHKHDYSYFRKVARQTAKLSGSKLKTLSIIEPDDWYKGVFRSEDGSEYQLNYTAAEIKEYNKEIKELVAAKEAEIREDKKQFIGRVRLENQGIDLSYDSPNRKTGRKVWCKSSNKKVRVNYIRWVKELASEAREVYAQWKLGDFSEEMPLGMFAPAMPRRANLIACL